MASIKVDSAVEKDDLFIPVRFPQLFPHHH